MAIHLEERQRNGAADAARAIYATHKKTRQVSKTANPTSDVLLVPREFNIRSINAICQHEDDT